MSEKGNRELLRRALRVEALPEGWREYFREELAKLERSPGAEASAGPGTSPCCT
ncbi:MAG: 3-alpha domain-containing protein [Candidatus Methylomirabilales bacterium]